MLKEILQDAFIKKKKKKRRDLVFIQIQESFPCIRLSEGKF